MDKLKQLRQQIEQLDEEIIVAVAQRLDSARKVGEYKKVNHLSIFNGEVENNKMKLADDLAKRYSLDVNFVRSLLYLIINESCKEQAKIQNN